MTIHRYGATCAHNVLPVSQKSGTNRLVCCFEKEKEKKTPLTTAPTGTNSLILISATFRVFQKKGERDSKGGGAPVEGWKGKQ